MLGSIIALSLKQPTDKSPGVTIKIRGGVSENILPEGRVSAGDPMKKGSLTLSIQGGHTWGLPCKMTARYKLTDGGGTEITWSIKPDEPLDDDRVAKISQDIRMEQVYTVSFKEQGDS